MNVEVDLSIISISALNLEKMELRVEIYLTQVNFNTYLPYSYYTYLPYLTGALGVYYYLPYLAGALGGGPSAPRKAARRTCTARGRARSASRRQRSTAGAPPRGAPGNDVSTS